MRENHARLDHAKRIGWGYKAFTFFNRSSLFLIFPTFYFSFCFKVLFHLFLSLLPRCVSFFFPFSSVIHFFFLISATAPGLSLLQRPNIRMYSACCSKNNLWWLPRSALSAYMPDALCLQVCLIGRDRIWQITTAYVFQLTSWEVANIRYLIYLSILSSASRSRVLSQYNPAKENDPYIPWAPMRLLASLPGPTHARLPASLWLYG